MTSVHLAHPLGLTPQPTQSTRMTLTCTHSLLTQSWLQKGSSNSISSLSSCGKSQNSSVWSTPAPSYQQIAESGKGAVLAILGGIADMQHLQMMGSKDLEGQEMAKKPLHACIPTLHALNFPLCWLQQKLPGQTRRCCFHMHSPSYLSPECTTEAHVGMKQCWPHKEALTVLSVGCLSAKNTCVTEHVSVFQMPQFQSTKLALCTGGRHILKLLNIFVWCSSEKDTIDQTQAMQSLQATLVRITDRFEIDVKIKNVISVH